MSDRMPDRMSEYMLDRMPDIMSEYMSDRMSDRMSQNMSDRMLDRMSQYMSDSLSEYQVRIYVQMYVMVGITRSKVFFCPRPLSHSAFCFQASSKILLRSSLSGECLMGTLKFNAERLGLSAFLKAEQAHRPDPNGPKKAKKGKSDGEKWKDAFKKSCEELGPVSSRNRVWLGLPCATIHHATLFDM